MNGDDANLGPEALLSDADGELAADVRARLDLALRYLANWYKATDDSGTVRARWWPQIDAVRAKVEAAFKAIDPNAEFMGNASLELYAQAQLVFPELWRQLSLSSDTLPKPDLLDQAADLLNTIAEYPTYLVPKIGDILARTIGGALGTIVGQLWYVVIPAALIAAWLIWRKAKRVLA